MTDQSSYMFRYRTEGGKNRYGEDISTEDLGGAEVHSTKSGVSHFMVENEEEGISLIRDLLSYLPSNNLEEAPMMVCNDPIDRLEDKLNSLIPDNPNLPYNMLEVIEAIVDQGKFLEVHKRYAGISSSVSAGWEDVLWVLSPTSLVSMPEYSISNHRVKQLVSFASATVSIFRS